MDQSAFRSFGEVLCKEAGVSDLWESFKDIFRGEKSKAQRRAAVVFSPDQKPETRWKNLPRNVGSSEFVKAVQSHPSADKKLKQHVRSMHDMTKGKTVGKVESSGGGGKSYEIRKMPGGNLGCTCGDWRYKGSVSPGYECKHIKKFKGGQTKLGANLTSFFDELDKIRKKTNDGAFYNDLLQDETPEEILFISPRSDEPDIIMR